jgi:hypothetical protein
MLDALSRARAQCEGAMAVRDRLIREAANMGGLTHTRIARAVGLTGGRISQILKSRRKN